MFHFLLHWTGSDNTSGQIYGFWSGFGSDLTEFLTVVGGFWIMIKRAHEHHKEQMRQREQQHQEMIDKLGE